LLVADGGNVGRDHYGSINLISINGAKLSEVRVALQLSMRELSEALPGCPKSTISRWEQGILSPSEDRVRRLVDLLGTAAFVSQTKKNEAIIKELRDFLKKKREGNGK
jgi:transcriptional regulator with XRE-family HTH domain